MKIQRISLKRKLIGITAEPSAKRQPKRTVNTELSSELCWFGNCDWLIWLQQSQRLEKRTPDSALLPRPTTAKRPPINFHNLSAKNRRPILVFVDNTPNVRIGQEKSENCWKIAEIKASKWYKVIKMRIIWILDQAISKICPTLHPGVESQWFILCQKKSILWQRWPGNTSSNCLAPNEHYPEPCCYLPHKTFKRTTISVVAFQQR